MKIGNELPDFKPITITLETIEEAEAFAFFLMRIPRSVVSASRREVIIRDMYCQMNQAFCHFRY